MADSSEGEEEGRLTGGSQQLVVDDDLREMGKKAAWSVSSYKPGNGVLSLRDDNLETYWQSDGAQPHLVNVQFQKKVKLQLVVLYVDFNKTADAPQYDLSTGSQNHPNSFDHQLNLPSLPASTSSEQPPMNSGLNMGLEGYNDSLMGTYTTESQNTNLSVNEQLSGAAFSQNHFVGMSQQAQPPGSESRTALHPPQPSFSSFFAANTPNSSYKGTDDFYTEEQIRTRSHEMLENDDMQHLLHIFNMDGQHHASSSTSEDNNYPYGSPYMPSMSSSFGVDEDRTRSGKAVVGWLKLKAALRWGIFIRKKAAEKRAQIVELDDP